MPANQVGKVFLRQTLRLTRLPTNKFRGGGGRGCLHPTLANRYTFDDVYIVKRDRLIRSVTGIPALFHQDWWAPFGRMGLYRPLTKVTFALGWVAAPGSPGWYHLVNILLHALAGLLASLPSVAQASDLRSAGSALEQSPGRLDIRRGTLVEYASACLRRGWRTGSEVAPDDSGRRPKPGHAEAYSTGGGLRRRHAEAYSTALWAGVFTFCSLLSKESGIVLPGLAVLAGWWLPQAGPESFFQRTRRVLANPALWTIAVAAVGYFALRVRIVGLLTRPPDFADNALWYLGPATRVRTALAFAWLCQQVWERRGSHAAGDGTPVEYASACRRRGLSNGSNRVQTRTPDAQTTRAERRRAARGKAASPWRQPRARAALMALGLPLADEELKLGDNAAVLKASRRLPTPLDPMAALAVGLAQLRLGQLAPAAATLAPVVTALPQNARAHLYYGQALHQLGREPEASQQLQWLAQHVPAGGAPTAPAAR